MALTRFSPLPPNFKIDTYLAIFGCISFSLIYVGALYISKKTRIGTENPGLTKDHPEVIIQRIKVTAATCIISYTSVLTIINLGGGFKNVDDNEDMDLFTKIKTTSILLGLWLPFNLYYLFNVLFVPLLLTMILFLGPLYVRYLDQELPFQERFSFISEFGYAFTTLKGFRNLIFAPFTEEFVFRSCMVPLLYYAKVNYQSIIWLTPLVFAFAHIHHAWEYYVGNGRTFIAAKQGILNSAFQFAYTTIFGCFATFVFMRTGNFFPPFIIHSFGNYQGFPIVNFAAYPKKQRSWLLGFGSLLFPMTSPGLYGETTLYWG
ncbi:18254_t:CDS:2 [Acaulospora morrowiae]|uniref:intramembrane prenyl-peptidase Rce1 n=1 Tax=Acaulospora morrowiae TaxID=94023 RepID=A0A9N9CXW9_9GLOM|nr:18254_t:CDS:2 [Acaulospora morrowiae]